MPEQTPHEVPTYEELEAALTDARVRITAEFNARREAERERDRAKAALLVAQHQVKVLRDGLAYYRPGPFWSEVIKDTKAAEDLGKHADWVLRVTAGADDPETA